MANTWTDEAGYEHAACVFCGTDCSTHPDAGNPLAPCSDCGAATCCDHRVYDAADRCVDCAARFYAEEYREAKREAHERVICRMDDGETLQDAVEAVYPDYGGMEFRKALVTYTNGER